MSSPDMSSPDMSSGGHVVVAHGVHRVGRARVRDGDLDVSGAVALVGQPGDAGVAGVTHCAEAHEERAVDVVAADVAAGDVGAHVVGTLVDVDGVVRGEDVLQRQRDRRQAVVDVDAVRGAPGVVAHDRDVVERSHHVTDTRALPGMDVRGVGHHRPHHHVVARHITGRVVLGKHANGSQRKGQHRSGADRGRSSHRSFSSSLGATAGVQPSEGAWASSMTSA